MLEVALAGCVLGETYSIDADLDHNYGYPKYPEYAAHYPGETAYLLACHEAAFRKRHGMSPGSFRRQG